MCEIERLGHVTTINLDEMSFSTNVFYLLHHGVITETSITTKMLQVTVAFH